MRYNPPPNWPRPPAGWSPPPGWEPDPAWGPAPPGWALWVADDAPPQQAAGVSSGGSSGGGRGLVWAAVAAVAVLVVGGIIGAVVLTRGSDTPAPAASGGVASATPAGGGATAPSTSASGGSDGCDGGGASPVPLGQAARVGSFCVALTRVTADATGEVLSDDPTNAKPSNGRYMVLELRAENTGQTTEDAFFSLYVTLTAKDGRTFTDADCTVVLNDDLVKQPETEPGATTTGQLCLDLPTEDLPGATLQIAPEIGGSGPVYATR